MTITEDGGERDLRSARGKRDRVARLRARLQAAGPQPHPNHVAAILAGILDLLGDEL